jgi:hypothetical protein
LIPVALYLISPSFISLAFLFSSVGHLLLVLWSFLQTGLATIS